MSSYRVETNSERNIDILLNSETGSSVMINRMGCELIGYRIKDSSGREIGLMYRDSQPEKPEKGWKNHATVLFPIVGGLKDNQSRLGSTVIKSPGNHGIARHSLFSLVETSRQDTAMARYRLRANDYTREYFPFDFQLDLTFALQGSALSVTFEIANPGSGPLHYCFGWHPGFRTPVIPGKGKKGDCRLVFPEGKIRKYRNNEHCRLTGETSMIDVGGPLEWSEEELEATLMFEIDDPVMRTVTLEDPGSGVSIRVDFPEMPHLGFWSEPGDEFICIEPWQGMDDHEDQKAFDEKLGVVMLAPGGRDTRTIKLTPQIA